MTLAALKFSEREFSGETPFLLSLRKAAVCDWRPIVLEEPLPFDKLPTPALIVSRERLERNLRRMQDHIESVGKAVRPHVKTHKCPIIAHRQIELGAVGVCAAKVSEAAVMVGSGVSNVLITSPLVAADKVRLLAHLAKQAEGLATVVDSDRAANLLIQEISDDVSLGVLLDIDVEMGRTGVRDIGALKSLRDKLLAHPKLRFEGVQHYAGHLMHVPDYEERRQRTLAGWERVSALLEELERDGPECAIVTGSGTGAYDIDCAVPRLTDIQVGSYIFMDREYRLIGGAKSKKFDDFDVSLMLAATVTSRPVNDRVTLDAGFKALASDTVSPVVLGREDWPYQFAGDEHGILHLRNSSGDAPALGEVLKLATPHCDPTVNLHDFYWIEDPDGLVREVWPIAARGCSW